MPKVDLSYYWHFLATSRSGTGEVGANLNLRSIPKTSEQLRGLSGKRPNVENSPPLR
jgi:hypothetical protein